MQVFNGHVAHLLLVDQKGQGVLSQGRPVCVTFAMVGLDPVYMPVFRVVVQVIMGVGLPGQEGALTPGEDNTSVIGEDLCALGQSFADVLNTGIGEGEAGMLGGIDSGLDFNFEAR